MTWRAPPSPQEYWFQHRDQALWGRVLSVLQHAPRPQCTTWPLECTFDQGLTDGWFDLRRHALQPLLQVADALLVVEQVHNTANQTVTHSGCTAWAQTLASLAMHVPPAAVLAPRLVAAQQATCAIVTQGWLRARACIDTPRLHVRGSCILPGQRAVVPLFAVDLATEGRACITLQASTRAAAQGAWTLCAVAVFADGSAVELCIASGAQRVGEVVHAEHAFGVVGSARVLGLGLEASGHNIDVDVLRIALS